MEFLIRTLTMSPLESTIQILAVASSLLVPSSIIAMIIRLAIPMAACKKHGEFSRNSEANTLEIM